ncbi:hypothetical protein GCM10008985_07850 [Halococcus dombrowskii]|uniref:Transposase n=1 Tax=Halococcus dombrowskii TaxID=179637 RepID=A0AAV3SDM8_HALDO
MPLQRRWLTAYTAYYNHDRSHQALENQTPIEALELGVQSSSARSINFPTLLDDCVLDS